MDSVMKTFERTLQVLVTANSTELMILKQELGINFTVEKWEKGTLIPSSRKLVTATGVANHLHW